MDLPHNEHYRFDQQGTELASRMPLTAGFRKMSFSIAFRVLFRSKGQRGESFSASSPSLHNTPGVRRFPQNRCLCRRKAILLPGTEFKPVPHCCNAENQSRTASHIFPPVKALRIPLPDACQRLTTSYTITVWKETAAHTNTASKGRRFHAVTKMPSICECW